MKRIVRWQTIILIAVFLLLTARSGLTAEFSIQINAQATVFGPQILFGELADIQGADADRVALLRNLKLGPAPLPGGRLVWTSQMLANRLLASGVDLSGIDWQTVPAVTMVAASQPVAAEQLATVAAAAIRQRLGPVADSGDIVICPVNEAADLLVAPGQVELSATLPQGVRYTAPTIVVIRAAVQDHAPVTVTLAYDIQSFRSILVAARDIGAHELITADAVRLERLEVGHLSGGYLTDPAEVIGSAARRPLAPGAVVAKNILEKPLLIRQGATVTIVAKTGLLEVTAMGEALQDGKSGQLIRVRNLQSRKIILAQVLDEGTVLAPSYYKS
ncbi:MAG: flagella basal body P-ring formation protein FlgA [Firmicutes bacterium]|nr:flagella basal body P-ring formation protein FlgA [Bacillota bacterium]